MQVYDIFCAFTDKIEPLSIDEAFLDVTESETDRSPEDIAMAIKTESETNFVLLHQREYHTISFLQR